jgi:hypothetical protein
VRAFAIKIVIPEYPSCDFCFGKKMSL